jgi:hypothetical protein
MDIRRGSTRIRALSSSTALQNVIRYLPDYTAHIVEDIDLHRNSHCDKNLKSHVK